MPEKQTTQPWAAAKDRPWGQKKRDLVKVELHRQYRRLGIAAVAAAAGARGQSSQLRKTGGR